MRAGRSQLHHKEQSYVIYFRLTIAANKIYACGLCDGRYSVPHQYTQPHFHTIFALPMKLIWTTHERINFYGVSTACTKAKLCNTAALWSSLQRPVMWKAFPCDDSIMSPVTTEAIFVWRQHLHEGSIYRKSSSIKRTQTQNLNVSRLVLQLSLPNPLKSCAKLSMKM